jgi:membrane protein DedA with SNARE-associated domain
MSQPQASPVRALIWAVRIFVLLVVVAAIVAVAVYGQQLRRFAAFGYPAIFLVCLITNASVLVPLPGLGITVIGGGLFNPFIVGLVGGLGQTIGALNSYTAGHTSRAALDELPFYPRVRGWMTQHGLLTVFVLATLPNPFFSAAVIVAGALRMPLRLFLPLCLAGKIIKSTTAALVGHYGIALLRGWLGG